MSILSFRHGEPISFVFHGFTCIIVTSNPSKQKRNSRLNSNEILIVIVPVDIWTSTQLPPALISSENEIGTDISMLPMSNNPGGCDIDGQFYMDGMKVCVFSNLLKDANY